MIYPTPRVPFGSSPEERGRIALELIEEALRTVLPPEDVAGVLVEPILGEGGYFVPPPGFLEGLQALCRRYGFRLIVDEVQTGLGRTGRWFAVEHWGVEPDILILGKALGGRAASGRGSRPSGAGRCLGSRGPWVDFRRQSAGVSGRTGDDRRD